MNINAVRTNLLRYGNRQAQHSNLFGGLQKQTNNAQGMNADKNANALRRMLSRGARADQNAPYTNSILESEGSYADSIRASRTKAKDTALKMKKLHYDFKSISTKILQSKTSANARQVAGQARREVMRLKRQRQNGEYDEEELQSAITHAEAMERVAKKKARHLEEEEMVKATGGPCAGELEEREDRKSGVEENAEAAEEKAAAEENAAAPAAQDAVNEAAQERMQAYQEIARIQQEELQEMMQAQMEALREMMQAQMEELRQAMEAQSEELQMANSSSMEDMMADMMDEMSEAMKEMLEDSGLSDLADSMFAAARTEMDPADLKMMKLKHRTEEMKAIAKADAEYLKTLFDRLEKMKDSGGGAIFGGGENMSPFAGIMAGGGAIVVSDGGAPRVEIDAISAPGDVSMPMPDVGGEFDISI